MIYCSDTSRCYKTTKVWQCFKTAILNRDESKNQWNFIKFLLFELFMNSAWSFISLLDIFCYRNNKSQFINCPLVFKNVFIRLSSWFEYYFLQSTTSWNKLVNDFQEIFFTFTLFQVFWLRHKNIYWFWPKKKKVESFNVLPSFQGFI